MIIREQANPEKIFHRIFIFFISLGIIQLFHLFFLTTAETNVFLTWIIFYGFFLTFFYLYYFLLKKIKLKIFFISYKILFFLLIIGFIGKIFSKYDYIESVLSVGLYYTRINSEIGGGGWSTYLSVWFYPSAILLSLVKIPIKYFKIVIGLVVIVILIDFIFIGTRGGPTLVILFFIVTIRSNFNKKIFIRIFFSIIIFISIFSYSTEYRSQDSNLGSFTWRTLLENTISTQVVSIKPEVIDFCEDNTPFLFPYIFLTHYLSHSIAELNYLISNLYRVQTGGANYFMRELCATGFCNQDYYTQKAESLNIRGAVYTTILGSLIYDSSFISAIMIIFIIIFFNLASIILTKRIGPFTITLWIIMSLASIENYFYTGLGLIQFILVFGIYYIYKIGFSFYHLNQKR